MATEDPKPHLDGGPEVDGSHVGTDVSGEAEGPVPLVPAKDWVQRAREMFASSTSWYDTNVRTQVERNLDNLGGRHPAGSKYYTKPYLHRSKIFRPKTRTAERDCEAAVAAAVFANRELLQVVPEDENDPEIKAHASVVSELTKARLGQPEAHWLKTVAGAVFDAWGQACVISKQHWVYETVMMPSGQQDDVGNPIRERLVKADRPMITLLPIEQFRFDPSANWLDPVNSSPYTIEQMPMPVVDVQQRMIASMTEGREQPWLWHNQDDMLATSKQDSDPTRRKREGRGSDSKGDTVTRSVREHNIVWIHVNIERDRFGVDWIWHTIGTELLLSHPVPLLQVQRHLRPGQRPYALGHVVVEPHRTNPPSPTELAEGLQKAINEVQNSRFDNVRLAMNRRFRVRRGASIDLDMMRQSVPGGAYEVDDVDKDVKEEAVQDVTGSAYQEQDRLNLDYDDMVGSFSSGSVQSNRQMNETVGGLNMVRGQANASKEYQVRTILTTWMMPALDQYVRMIQFYETDQTVLAVAGRKAKHFRRLYQQFETADDGTQRPMPLPKPDETLLESPMQVRLLVGLGAGDPVARVANLVAGVDKVIQLPGMQYRLNGEEVANEIFSAVGYDDGERFLHDTEDQEYLDLRSQIEELTQFIETKQLEQQGQMQREQMKAEMQQAMKQAEIEFQAQVEAVKDDQVREEMRLQRDTLIWNMYLEEFDRRMKLRETMLRESMPAPQPSGSRSNGGSPIGALPGKAGVMARNQYGDVPHARG